MKTKIVLCKKIPGSKILAETVDGQMLVLKHVFAHRDDAKLFTALERIRTEGAINTTHWRPARRGEF